MQITVENNIIDSAKYIGREIVNLLAKKYNFNSEEAINYLEINTSKPQQIDIKKNNSKTSIPLPFCNYINPNCCHGVRLNYGLYTQCNNKSSVYNTEYPVCETCNKQIQNNSNNKPTYGFISARLADGPNYRDPKGKAPTNYANIMQKMNISKEDAELAAKKMGLVIPDYEFIIKKVTRGRPKKDTTADDTESEASFAPIKTEKKRGRPPKKNKEIVSVDDVGNSMLKDLMKDIDNDKNSITATAHNKKEPKNVSNETSDTESDATEAHPIKLNKKRELGYIIVDNETEADYLLTSDNQLYSPFTHDYKGVWNAKTKKIEITDSDDEY
jgi:hypothetical protein